jgi:hypothetical protein
VTADALPRPLAAPAKVTIDAAERTLVVKQVPDVRGYAKVLWSEGHRAQVQSLQMAPGDAAPTVWAAGAGHDRIAYGLPGDAETLRFRFSRGDPNYRKLVSTPGLTATVVVDRENSQILGVRFHGCRPASGRR